MRHAIALSRRGMEGGAGGPFGAVVVKDGQVVAEGWNQVTSTNDPTAHAEVVAIRRACTALGRFDLQVMLNGTADSNIVERFTDVTMDSTSDRYVIPVVNSDTRGSVYIRLTDSNSATATPNDTPAVGTFDLASGSNGTAT